MMLVDTHSHLYLGQFDPDRDQVVRHAADKGIRKILLPNIDSHSIGPMNQLAATYPDTCHPMMGLHPTSVKDNYREEFEMIRKELLTGRYIAVGEIGIDLYWDKTHLREQCLVFEQELDIAVELDTPVVIHARESFDEIFEILQKYQGKGLKGIFHAFSGSPGQAAEAVERGFLIGIGGRVTYRKSGVDRTVRELNLRQMVLETDSPFLPPDPNRGKRNEPAFITFVAEAVSRLKSVDTAEVARVTSDNAMHLFRLNQGNEP